MLSWQPVLEVDQSNQQIAANVLYCRDARGWRHDQPTPHQEKWPGTPADSRWVGDRQRHRRRAERPNRCHGIHVQGTLCQKLRHLPRGVWPADQQSWSSRWRQRPHAARLGVPQRWDDEAIQARQHRHSSQHPGHRLYLGHPSQAAELHDEGPEASVSGGPRVPARRCPPPGARKRWESGDPNEAPSTQLPYLLAIRVDSIRRAWGVYEGEVLARCRPPSVVEDQPGKVSDHLQPFCYMLIKTMALMDIS